MPVNIAIDGPAGAGKSTIARILAKELNAVYVDTGAMYRAMALYFLEHGIAPEDLDEVRKAVRTVDIALRYEDGEQRIFLCGEDVTGKIRTEEVSRMASVFSVIGEVREKLVELQRKIASEQAVVMDGRDIGTVVLPDAEVKIYLTASSRVRAMRRLGDLAASRPELTLEEVEKEILERDYRDMHREHSPLKKAEDAVEVDTSDMTKEEVVECLKEIARKACGEQ